MSRREIPTGRERETFEEQAKIITSNWEGEEKEKAKKLLSMLEAEIANCCKFIEEVYAPISA